MTPHHDIKVIARFLDGSLVKGTTLDFFPTKDHFHITEEDGNVLDVHIGALKAVFFVRDFEGNPDYTDKKGFLAPAQGKKVMVEFVDGEVMFGYTLSYSARGLGFFMFPGDPGSNNTKVFIVNNATRRVKVKTLGTPLGARPMVS